MCVIMAAETARVSPDMIRAGFKSNPHGAGIAYREKNAKNEVVVRWKKGIDSVDEVIALEATLELPYVLHFRIPTEGGNDRDLCHPFPVTKNVELFRDGITHQPVLFHNGTWGDWRRFSLEHAFKGAAKVKLPKGKFSDSRMLAWNTFHLDTGFLDLINEKVLLFGVDDIQIFGLYGWKLVNDVWCSNDNWIRNMPSKQETKPEPKQVMGPAQRAADILLPNDDEDDDTQPNVRPSGVGRGSTFPESRGGNHSGAGGNDLTNSLEGSAEALQAGTKEVFERNGVTIIRRSLIDDPKWIAEYRKLHGHDPRVEIGGGRSISMKDWVSEQNPKVYRSSGRKTDDKEIARHIL